MAERVERIEDSVIVYDDALVGHIDLGIFAAPDEQDTSSTASPLAGRGRGRTLVISVAGRSCVLRHYYRGGMIRHASRDSFVWTGGDRTRSLREWRLLANLRRRGLPVPRPVAARYVRSGLFYTADLITERIADVESLAAVLGNTPLDGDAWHNVGETIARFHAGRVFHADLNAHNIQIDGDGRVYLLDFDRGRIMPATGEWSRRNLQRLRRSLDKISRQNDANFTAADWESLLRGYAAGRGR